MSKYLKHPKSDYACKFKWWPGWDSLVNKIVPVVGSPDIEIADGKMAIDTHIHSLFSACSISQPYDIILKAVSLGLSGICVMDHNTVAGALDTEKCAEHLKNEDLIPHDFLVIPGIEVRSSLGHIGALFVTQDITPYQSVDKTVEEIHSAGGLAVAVHPFHTSGIKEGMFEADFDAFEYESGAVFSNTQIHKAQTLVSDSRFESVTKLGSSDAHYISAIGMCYTVFDKTSDNQSLITAIKSAKTEAKRTALYTKIQTALKIIPQLR